MSETKQDVFGDLANAYMYLQFQYHDADYAQEVTNAYSKRYLEATSLTPEQENCPYCHNDPTNDVAGYSQQGHPIGKPFGDYATGDNNSFIDLSDNTIYVTAEGVIADEIPVSYCLHCGRKL